MNNFDEKKEAYNLAIFLKHQCRINEEEFDEILTEFFNAVNIYENTAGMETFFDNLLYRREIKAYRYVALQKIYDFYKKVRQIRDYDVFKELKEAIKKVPSLQ